jgi:hypothetical protein
MKPESSSSPTGLPFETAWEANLQRAARDFDYPPTPDLKQGVRQKITGRAISTRLPALARLALAALVLVLASLFAVPSVRAQVLEWIQVGAVRIWLVEPTHTPTPSPSPTPVETRTPQPTLTPQPTPTPLRSVLDLPGETTLADARERVVDPILLPSYPPDLGEPDRVFLQADTIGYVVVLVWAEPDDPQQARLTLYQISSNAFGLQKGAVEFLEETEVNGWSAYWVEGPHILQADSSRTMAVRLIDGNTLLWTDGNGVTYRLESPLTMPEVMRIAESLE